MCVCVCVCACVCVHACMCVLFLCFLMGYVLQFVIILTANTPQQLPCWTKITVSESVSGYVNLDSTSSLLPTLPRNQSEFYTSVYNSWDL